MEYKEIRNVQLIALDILKEIVRICDENGINYFIVAGTALGAVRHGGFIPWDDDLDIGMSREDYDLFLKIAPKELPKDLFLQTVDTDPQSPFYFAKVRKSGTKFVEEYCKNLNIHHGIFVDIFPYDNIPDDVKEREKHHKKVAFWANLFIAKCLTGSSVKQYGLIGKLKLLIRTLIHVIVKPVPKRYLFKKLNSACQEYNGISCQMKSFVKDPCMQIPSKDIDVLDEISFEKMRVKCPGQVTSYLTHNYGDYMTLPPEEKRVGHEPYILEL